MVSINAPTVSGAFVYDFNQAVEKGIPLLVPRATLRTSFERLQEGNWSEGLILSALPALYGAPHLIGWFAVFPTTWERIAWRVSSLVVMGSGLAVFVLFGAVTVVRHWMKPEDETEEQVSDSDRPHGSFPLLHGIVNRMIWVLVLVPYAVASGFLLVESFRQLFALPPGAFELPSWTGSFPHFG